MGCGGGGAVASESPGGDPEAGLGFSLCLRLYGITSSTYLGGVTVFLSVDFVHARMSVGVSCTTRC